MVRERNSFTPPRSSERVVLSKHHSALLSSGVELPYNTGIGPDGMTELYILRVAEGKSKDAQEEK
jgi:hypothetical protein